MSFLIIRKHLQGHLELEVFLTYTTTFPFKITAKIWIPRNGNLKTYSQNPPMQHRIFCHSLGQEVRHANKHWKAKPYNRPEAGGGCVSISNKPELASLQSGQRTGSSLFLSNRGKENSLWKRNHLCFRLLSPDTGGDCRGASKAGASPLSSDPSPLWLFQMQCLEPI